MRLDQMTVALRVRSPWQAMDLGLRMVRANARAIWLPYFLFTAIAFALCNLLAFSVDAMWLGWVLMWWLKPVFDRIPLHVLSRVTFGTYPDFRETLRAPFQWKFSLWASWLSYRRFSCWRSLSMPIDILEGLDSGRLSQRRTILVGAVSSQVIGLTIACMMFEWVLASSIFVLFYMFVPIEYLNNSVEEFFTRFFQNPEFWTTLLLNAVFFLAAAIISPFYVGAGFAVYLNRRTQLEAWDIEIAFKRMISRFRQSGTMLLALAVLSGGFALTPASRADEIDAAGTPDTLVAEEPGHVDDATGKSSGNTGKTADVDEKSRTLQELLGKNYRAEPAKVAEAVRKAYRDKNLSPREKYTSWELRDKKTEKPEKKNDAAWDGNLFGGLFDSVGSAVAILVQYGLWLLLALVLSLLIWKAADWIPWRKDKARAKREFAALSEKEILDLDSLPGDLGSVVRQLWAQQPRAALALLYRGSVEKLAERLGAAFPPGATEAECVRRSRRLAQPESEAIFQTVVRAWQAAAYAHRLPSTDEFESLLREWSVHWEKQP